MRSLTPMPKSEECESCQMFSGYLGQEFLVCGIHPVGPSESPCPDFAEVVGHWEPLGAAYYGGELVLQPEHYLSKADRMELLNTHPLFTGVCPQCKAAIEGEGLVHYDCPSCDWRDETVS